MLLSVAIVFALPSESDVFAALLARLDTDRNGRLSAAEYARVDEVTPFSALDHDADGEVDVDELAAFVKVTPPRRGGRRPGDGGRRGGGGGGGPATPVAAGSAGPGTGPAVPLHTSLPGTRPPSDRAAVVFAVGAIAAIAIGAVLGRRGRQGRRRRRRR
jgi:hypothetical protein